ncbi:protocadherin Fat 4-like [Ylistrum balloti]|uniref:protocadherin Fat 4-like n=1 Tax=Ylistrum balloti TaxID=509963 RepID=UPI002905984E|nr:protocadherin Fat 4-like [Ylistrum balloti]
MSKVRHCQQRHQEVKSQVVSIETSGGQKSVTSAVSCGSVHNHTGFTDLVKKDQKLENKEARGYVVRDSLYTFHCCGVITSWEIVAGYTGSIELMVWKSAGTDDERLVGKNVRSIGDKKLTNHRQIPFFEDYKGAAFNFKATSVNPPGGEELGELLTFNIPEAEQIIVEPGDRIGWYCSNFDILVAYRKGGQSIKNNYYMEDMTNTNVGETVTLSKNDNDATFGIKAYTEQGRAPTFSGLPTSVTIDSDLAQGSTIYIPVVDNPNSLDSFTFSETGVVSTYFTVNSITGVVTVSLSSTLVPGTYTVDITVTNTCLFSTTATLTVIVQNKSPVIQGLPTTTSIHEDTTGETTLYEFQTSDAESDSVACSLPITSPFYIKKETASHFVCYKGSPALSYSTQSSYTLSVLCTDGFTNVSSTVNILVVQNQPPAFTNLPGAVTVSAKNTASSVSVFTVTVSDPDDNYTSISMTCSSCPFTLYPDGRVVTSKILRDEAVASFVLSISLSDTKVSVGPALLTVILTDHNSAPSFSNLPTTLYIPETTPLGSSIYKLSFTDPDVNDTLGVATGAIQPVSGGSLFEFNTSDGSLYVRSTATLDYEYLTVKNYTISYVVDDGISSSTSSVEIVVLDENEAPSFSSATYFISTNEDNPGTALPSASLSVNDPDDGDTHTYSIDGGIDAGYFSINKSTGDISFSAIYDVLPGQSPKVTELIVKATDNGGLTCTTTVSVTVSNVNKPPTFTNIPSTIQISEDIAAGSSIYAISTNDLDGDIVQIHMTPDTIMTSSIIIFNSTQNVVFLADGFSLNYETCSVHNLTFVAFDGTDQSIHSILTIQVTNSNEPPVFSTSSYHVSVQEALADEVVFRGSSFTVTDEDTSDTFTYSIDGGTEASFFAINQSTGNVLFAADYDVSPSESPKTTELIIKATDAGYLTSTTTLFVTITNVNKPPYFSNLPQIVTISEDSSTGSTIYITSAADPDLDTVQLFMTTDSLLTSSKVTFNNTGGILTVNAPFDYETCTVHIVTFTAFDGTTYSNAANLTIHVTNANESPEVAQTTYFLSTTEGKINEELTLPVPLFPVSDPDGDFPLTYSLVSNSHSQYFTINATSGVLYYTVDFICSLLSPDVAVLVIRVSDPNGGYIDTNIQISITHTNTKPTALNLPANVTFPESFANGGFLYTVNLYDPDGESMSCRFLYSPSSAFSTFAITQYGSSLNVSLSETFDYEVTSLYTIYVIINDGIEDSDTYELRIIISDVNEPPSFSENFYDVTTQEDKADEVVFPGSSFTVTDEDTGDTFTLSIDGGTEASSFAINQSTGNVLFAADYEVSPFESPKTTELIIKATDAGYLTSTTTLFVTITNVNKPPYFSNLPQIVTISEDSSTGSTIYITSAADPDLDTVQLFMTTDSLLTSSKVTFNNTGGILTVNAPFDYETCTVHIVTFTAFDGTTYSNAANLTIHVTNANESPEVAQTTYFLSTTEGKINEELTLPVPLFPVSDPDGDFPLTYSLVSNSHSQYFTINATSGVLYYTVDFICSLLSPDVAVLVIRVSDPNGGYIDTNIQISITHTNTKPTALNLPANVTFPESFANGGFLYTVNLYDPDGESMSCRFLYTPSSAFSTFAITQYGSSLNVSLSGTFDYEVTSLYTIYVIINDGIEDSDTYELRIIISDVNEPPSFSENFYNVTTQEDKADGVVFPGSSFTVTDEDTGDTFTLNIDGGTETSSFAINQSTGNVLFAADYEVSPFESPKTTELIIKATDAGYLTSTTTLFVTITNVNKPPYFSNLPQIVTISEDSSTGSRIYITSAADPDLDTVQLFMTTDSLLTSSKVTFNNTGGILTVNAPFDYETCTVHIVTFTAFDGTTYSNAANLTIHVTNANESPEVAQTTYFLSTTEGKINEELTLPVPLFPVSDPDGDFPLTYSLVSNSHSQYFTINATSGVLYYTVDFICSLLSPDVAVLVIRVSDPNGGYIDTNIQISITHTNTKPTALNLPANVTFPESFANSGFLYTVNLYDPDGESMSCRFLYSPSSAFSTFAITQYGSSLNVSLSETFDYEVTSLYTIYVIINDGIEDSDTYELRIIISDVNEPPSFSENFYEVTTQEDENGTLISNVINFADEDSGDILSVSIKDGNGHGRFYLDGSARLFFHVDYDVDDTSFPEIVNLTLEAKDLGMLSATTLVRVTISDVNDNAPLFGTTQYVHSTPNSTVGSTVLTVSATDLDSGLNGECVYLLNNSYSNPYRDNFAVSESGTVLLMKSVDNYSPDHVFTFDVIVNDKGTPPLSSTSAVRLVITQEVVSVETVTSAQVAEQQEVDVANLLARPEMLGMFGAVIAGIVFTAIGNIVCWLRSKATGKEIPASQLNKKTPVPNPPLKKPKMPRSFSIDTPVEDYSCWDEVSESGKSKLSQTSSDPGVSTSRVEVITPFPPHGTSFHVPLSRTRSITQYVSHMPGSSSAGFI